jgi:Fe-S cluster assembly protein SufD
MGELDEELKFYLMARGIPASEAEALLIQAFVGEVVDAIENEGIKDALMNATMSWLGE